MMAGMGFIGTLGASDVVDDTTINDVPCRGTNDVNDIFGTVAGDVNRHGSLIAQECLVLVIAEAM